MKEVQLADDSTSFFTTKLSFGMHTGAETNFLSRNYQELDVWKMWILWKMRLWKCEFYENWDFIIVTFVKNEISERWIL